MRNVTWRARALAAAAFAALAVVPALAAADTIGLVGLTQTGEIVKFSSDTPSSITTRVTVSGLVEGDRLVSIVARLSTHQLLALSNTGRLYVVDLDTGVATVVRQDVFEVPLTGTVFSFDVNPVTGEVFLVSDTGLNLRVDASTGAVIDADPVTPGVQGDVTLAYALGDLNFAQTPHVVAIAFDQNDTATTTTLFGIDANTNTLVTIGSAGGGESPTTGMVHTVGSLGVDVIDVAAFEIANDTTAFAVLTNTSGMSNLSSIDLTTGTATVIGPIGAGEQLIGLSVSPIAGPPASGSFAITRVTMKFDYKRTGRDQVTVMGNLPFTGSFSGRNVTIDVGGFTKSFVLNLRGRAKDKNGTKTAKDDDTFMTIGRVKNGVVRFKATFRREDLQTALADENLVGTEIVDHESRAVLVTVTLDGTPYTVGVNLDFKANPGRTGIARSIGVATP
jgi:uncharacterized protein DUF4394